MKCKLYWKYNGLLFLNNENEILHLRHGFLIMIFVIWLRRQSADIWIPPKYTSKECEYGNDKQNEKTDSHRVKTWCRKQT